MDITYSLVLLLRSNPISRIGAEPELWEYAGVKGTYAQGVCFTTLQTSPSAWKTTPALNRHLKARKIPRSRQKANRSGRGKHNPDTGYEGNEAGIRWNGWRDKRERKGGPYKCICLTFSWSWDTAIFAPTTNLILPSCQPEWRKGSYHQGRTSLQLSWNEDLRTSSWPIWRGGGRQAQVQGPKSRSRSRGPRYK